MRPRYQQDGGGEMNSDIGPSDRTTAEDTRTVGDSDVVDVLATLGHAGSSGGRPPMSLIWK